MDEKNFPIEMDEDLDDEDIETGFKPEKPKPIRFIPLIFILVLFGIVITDYYVRDTLNGKLTDKTSELGHSYIAFIPTLENIDTLRILLTANTLYTMGKFKSIILPDSGIYNTLASHLCIPDSIIIINDNISTSIEKQLQNDTILIISTKENNERLIYNTKKEKNIKGFYLPEKEIPLIAFFKDKWRHLLLAFK